LFFIPIANIFLIQLFYSQKQNQSKMKKRDYERPTMDVVEVKQQAQLLAGSVGASRGDYGVANEDTWEE